MATLANWLPSFQANTGTADVTSVSDPKIIGLSNGNYLVAWVETGTTGVATAPGTDIIGKIFDAEGVLVKDSFQLNTNFQVDDERDFDLGATNDGGFIMVFVDDDISSPNGEVIRWSRHDSNGIRTHSATVATNDVADDVLSNPQVAVDTSNNTSYVTFTDNVGAAADDIRAVRLNSTGSITTAEFDAAQNSTDYSRDGDSAVLANGNLVTVYEEDDAGTGSVEIAIRTTAGTTVTTLEVSTSANAIDPQVASLVNGNFVVTWVEGNDILYWVLSNTGGSVSGRSTAASGADSQNEPEIVALPTGGFVIVWDNDTDNTVEARAFSASGAVDGPAVVIDPAGSPTQPDVGVTGDGRVLFTWLDGSNAHSSIWDPRDGTIDASDFTGSARNFVNDGNIITSRAVGATVNGDSSSETIIGRNGNDILNGNNGNDTISGNGGHDTINGGANVDTLSGGIGNDTFVQSNNHSIDNIAGDSGTDTLDASGVTSTSQAINVDFAANTWTGLGGTRSIAGIEKVIGTQGADTIDLDGLDGGEIDGQGGDDILTGGYYSQTIFGGAGHDTIDGGFAVGSSYGDVMNGGTGNDVISGAFGNDSVVGGSGNDTITTNAGVDTVNAGTGNDTITGGIGDDILNGKAGNDLFIWNNGDGSDTMNGSTGLDTVKVNADSVGDDSFIIDDMPGSRTDISRTNLSPFTLDTSGIDLIEVNTGGGNDVVDGSLSKVKQLIRGGSGDDELTGGINVDIIRGGGGVDIINGGGGKDDIDGGTGNDTINGGGNHDVIEGGTGEDFLSGSFGNDTLRGGAHDDLLKGNGGRDTLEGGDGDDILKGGSFKDTLTGGPGADAFVFGHVDAFDVVTDFDLGVDVIQLDDSTFNITVKPDGTLRNAEFNTGNSASDFSDRIIYNPASGSLFYDEDGVGPIGQIKIASLDPGLALTQIDFEVV